MAHEEGGISLLHEGEGEMQRDIDGGCGLSTAAGRRDSSQDISG